MLNRWGNRSLKTKIMSIFILMSVALTLILGFLFYNNTVERVKDAKVTEMTTLALETTNKIERFLFERSADVKVLAESKILTTPEISQATRLDYIKNVVEAYKTYDDVFVIDLSGTVQLTAKDSEGVEHFSAIKDKVLSGDLYISDFIYFDEMDQYFIYFSQPLFNSQSEEIGAVVEKMNFDAIQEIVTNVKLGDEGFAVLEKLDPAADLDQVVGVSTVEIDGTSYLSATYPIVKYPSQENQWMLVVRQPINEAFGVLHDIERYFISVIAILLCIFFVLSSIMSNTITKPIRTLMERINDLMAGNKGYADRDMTSDEVKRLTSTFDLLLEELHFLMRKVLEKSGEAASMGDIRQSMDTLIEQMPSGIMTIDYKGDIISLNHAAMGILDIELEQLIGRNVMAERQDKFARFFGLLAEGLRSNILYDEKVCYLTNDSANRVEIVFSTLRQTDLNDTFIGMTVVLQNLEEKKKFEDSVLRAKKLSGLGELSAGVAHEIRNPLASIRGYAQLALSEIESDHQAHQDLLIIMGEVDRLDKIIERFLNFAVPDSPKYGCYALNAMIDETVMLLSPDLEARHVELDLQLDEKDQIEMDYDQIKQVLINLILNAVQAMPQGGHVQIATERSEQQRIMEITVTDEGEGISQELREKIFTPFYTTRKEGTGLGLSICSRIVENHKGVIELVSQMGKGTRMIVRLPIAYEGENR